jgi:hypothetical protein
MQWDNLHHHLPRYDEYLAGDDATRRKIAWDNVHAPKMDMSTPESRAEFAKFWSERVAAVNPDPTRFQILGIRHLYLFRM